MISPLKWMERVGVSGRLLAFFKAVGVYFAVGGEAGGRAPSPAAAAAKCAPVLCLLLIVLAHRAETPAHLKELRRYSLLVASGLALGALGDGLLVWPQHFVAGMAAFGAGHVLYMAAFGWRPARPGLAAGLLAATAAYLAVVQAPGVLRLLVPPYALLLAGAAWRGAARGGAAAAGATLFLLSDAALGYTMFAHPLPHQEVLVMSTYYLGQLGVALSALKPPPAPAPAPAH